MNDLENLFKTKFITENGNHELDNKSKVYQSYFQYKNGSNVRVECYDWINKTKKKYGFVDNLSISLVSKELQRWISDGWK